MSPVFLPPDQVRVSDHNYVLVDVRNTWEYEEGHLPKAVNLPFEDFRSPADETPGKLPTADAFGALLGGAGITRNDHLVAYDDQFGVYASRFVVTAEVFGHAPEQLYLLDGDYTMWRQQHGTSTEPPSVDSRTYNCDWAESGPLITARDLEAALETDAVIVDTRRPGEYNAVHVRDAINVQWRTLIDESQRHLKSRSRCRDILADNGVRFDRPVRLYCNTARRLSFVYAVLRELGHGDVAVYEGGIDAWAEYGGPVETI